MRAIKRNVEEKVLPRAACVLYAAMAVLSEATWEKVREMFPSGQDSEVAKLLQTECGSNLPFVEKETPLRTGARSFCCAQVERGKHGKAGCGGKAGQC